MASGFCVTIGFQVEAAETDVGGRQVVVELHGLLQVVFRLVVVATRLQSQRQLDVGFGSSRVS